MHAEAQQKHHYNRIATEYEINYGDQDGVRYREKFLYEPMFAGLDLEGRNVLEALCGGGHASAYLLSHKRALVTGLDISEEAIAIFKERWPQCEGVCSSITASGLPDESFDYVVVIMGLHHLHPHLVDALYEIHRILRKGGSFCFTEPHKASAFSRLRALWYRHDHYFADNEDSVDLGALKQEFGGLFDFRIERYVGGAAYLLVLNSMIFRVPLRLKQLYSPAVMRLEMLLGRFHTRALSLAVVCQWQKK